MSSLLASHTFTFLSMATLLFFLWRQIFTFILNIRLMKIISLLLLLTILATLHSNPQAQSPFDTTMYGRNPKAAHYLTTRGFKMYYEIYGKGEPLLIIHGNGGSINNFLYQIPYFSKQYKVIVADSRSQGKSVDNNDSLSYEMMADDLNALLDSLNVDS